ncbi:MAG: c-type cytochrome [Myxococcales bacterium]|nr:c-type cytochrome [Myxococcales bacterium]
MLHKALAVIGLLALSMPALAGDPPPMRSVEITPEKAAQGAKLFQLCTPCHGTSGADRVPRAALLTAQSFLEAASDEMIITTIKGGRPGTAMAAWAGVLDRGQMESIVAYLRTQTKTEPAKLDESPLKGDGGEGAKLFMRSCVQCHNMRGGYREWGTGILRKPFLDTVTNGYLRYMIKNGKTGTAMQGFASGPLPELTLSDAQIEHVITFLRSLP